MSLLIHGATIIDGVSNSPVEGQSIWIEAGRIKGIDRRHEFISQPGLKSIDARGKFVIPGLMDANVHLMGDIRFEGYVRYEGRYEDLITEAAQVALKSGLTTVFDTWGPRKPLMTVRDSIQAGHLVGSRMYCAGNIIGLDGPFSLDFMPKTLGVAGSELVERTNALYVENVGPDLTWMTPEEVAREVRTYIRRGVDFVKFASSEHRASEHEATASILFSPRVQAAIVEEAHRAGITAQAHTTAVEALRVALEAGCDIIQHCNITGPVPIPDATLELIAEKRIGAVVFPFTKRRLDLIMQAPNPWSRRYFSTADTNCQNLVRFGAMLLLATDGLVPPPDIVTDVKRQMSWMREGEDNLSTLGQGHFAWLKAMEEKGLPPLDGLLAATRNIAVAYGKEKDLGTLETGKIADLIVLDQNPLGAAENYRSINMVVKDGIIVDRGALPIAPVLTKGIAPRDETVASYGRFAMSKYPCCF